MGLDKSTIEVTFELPSTHPDAAITDILLEYKPKSAVRWKTETIKPNRTEVRLEKLEPNTKYEIRICCSNEAGQGQFSTPVQAKTKPSPKTPDAPKLLDAQSVDTNSVMISWTSPKCDGFSPICIYQIEFCDISTPIEMWQLIDAMNIEKSDQKLIEDGDKPINYVLTITNLDNTKTFSFRVIAVNSVGPGKPSQSSKPITPGNCF